MKKVTELDSMAISYRKELGEDSLSPIDIFSVAKTMEDLTLVLYPMGKKISGMCIKGKNSNLIAINSSMSLGRQRFSLAHELYHLRFDQEMGKNICSMMINGNNAKEKEADQFASHLLLPSAALYNAVKDCIEVDQEKVIWLEQSYGMSRKAMLVRLTEEEKINPTLCSALEKNVQLKAAQLGYDTALYKPLSEDEHIKTTGYYIRIANKLLDDKKISVGKYEQLLLDAFRDDLVYGSAENEMGVEVVD